MTLGLESMDVVGDELILDHWFWTLDGWVLLWSNISIIKFPRSGSVFFYVFNNKKLVDLNVGYVYNNKSLVDLYILYVFNDKYLLDQDS